MKFRQSIFLLTVFAMIAVLVACSSMGKPTILQAISVALAGAPTSLSTTATADLKATITNDSANAGLTWSVTCGSTTAGDCGVLSNTTATTATYTAPAAVPNPGKTVTITATSNTDTSRTASATITIELISVKLDGASSSLQTLLTNATAPSLMATVTNDSANAGVTWSVTCGSTTAGACGALSNTTATTATYTAPAAVPTGRNVTVKATSVTDATKFATATMAIAEISVTLAGAPTSLQIDAAAPSLMATVNNDPANAGVTWSVTCGSTGACGTFSNTTATTATYTAPAAVPAGNIVTVVAASVTDTTKSASATITITPPPLADGTYVFSLAGMNANDGSPYHVAGAFVVSGGVIISGEQDYVDDSVAYQEDPITSGTVTTTADGNLQITLTTTDGSVGEGGVEILDAALVSSSRARIIEFDGTVTSSGRMDLQTSKAAPASGYAFFTAGLDASFVPVAIGGVINIDGSGTISGTGSVFDINDGGSVSQDQSFAPSTVTTPDGFGRVVFDLVPSGASGVSTINLAGYIVDATHIRLVETTGDSFLGATGGIALGQGVNTGTFGSISGNSYVVGVGGLETSFAVLQSAGVLTANSDGTVSGAINYNDLSGNGPQTPSPITGGTYTVDATGRVTMTGVTDGIASFTLQLYLTGDGQESEETVVSMDGNDVLAGLGWQQTGGGTFTAASFSGAYVLDATGVDTSLNELDAVGPVTADGVATLKGAVDLNSLSFGQFTALPVSATFTADPSGAFSGTIAGLDVTSNSNQDVFTYYLIDTTKVFAIETDTNQLTLGFFTLEQ